MVVDNPPLHQLKHRKPGEGRWDEGTEMGGSTFFLNSQYFFFKI